MNVLVTGCAGFIGSAVARLLLDAGHTVVGVDEMNDYYDVNLKRHRVSMLDAYKAFSFHRADVADRPTMNALFVESGFDRVFHLAARAGVRHSTVDPWIYTHSNIDGTVTLLEACRTHDVDRLLMASTSSLYGLHNPLPFKEDGDTTRPLSPYAATKLAAEGMCACYSHLYGIDTIVPRYFTVYGPAGRPDMSVYRFIEHVSAGTAITLYGDGEQERDFTYIDDIASGTVMAAEHLDGHEVVNLGNCTPVTINQLVRTIEEQLGKQAEIDRLPMHAADMPKTWANIEKAREFGWEPTTQLHEGIASTVAWHETYRRTNVDGAGAPASTRANAPSTVSVTEKLP